MRLAYIYAASHNYLHWTFLHATSLLTYSYYSGVLIVRSMNEVRNVWTFQFTELLYLASLSEFINANQLICIAEIFSPCMC